MNAIIAAATGYTEADLKIFLESIKLNCRDVKVFLIVFQKDSQHIEKLRSKYPFVQPVYIYGRITKRLRRVHVWIAHILRRINFLKCPPSLQKIGTYSLHIVVERFFIMLDIVRNSNKCFSNVLLTDCRDVVIQKNPFELIENQLVSGLEVKKIGDDQLNRYWISSMYGAEILSIIQDKNIVCAGVTLGPANEIKDYLNVLCCEMWRHLPQMIKLQFGPDQAAHNYLIYSNQVKCTLSNSQNGLISTVDADNEGCFIKNLESGVVEIGGIVPAILHQYDRSPRLSDFFKEKYC